MIGAGTASHPLRNVRSLVRSSFRFLSLPTKPLVLLACHCVIANMISARRSMSVENMDPTFSARDLTISNPVQVCFQ